MEPLWAFVKIQIKSEVKYMNSVSKSMQAIDSSELKLPLAKPFFLL